MGAYQSNSFKSKEQSAEAPDRKIEKIIEGEVKTKRKSGIQKFANMLISDDVTNVRSYLLTEVFVPALKKMISEGVDALLYTGTGRSRESSARSERSYQRYYTQKNDRRDRDTYRPRNTYDYEDVIFDNRGEAEEVLSALDEQIEKYDVASVSDFYELVGITPNFTDNKYGWTDIRSAYVVRLRDGYMIKFPKAAPLN